MPTINEQEDIINQQTHRIIDQEDYIINQSLLIDTLENQHYWDVQHLTDAQSQVSELQKECDELHANVTFLEGEVYDLQSRISSLQSRLSNQSSTRNFNSLAELRGFLSSDDTHLHQFVPGYFDCFDFAMMLSNHAFDSGYRIYPMEVYLDVTTPPANAIGIDGHVVYTAGNHVMDIAYVNNVGWYLIEPQSNAIAFLTSHLG